MLTNAPQKHDRLPHAACFSWRVIWVGALCWRPCWSAWVGWKQLRPSTRRSTMYLDCDRPVLCSTPCDHRPGWNASLLRFTPTFLPAEYSSSARIGIFKPRWCGSGSTSRASYDRLSVRVTSLVELRPLSLHLKLRVILGHTWAWRLVAQSNI